MSKGGGTNTTTTTQSIDPAVKQLVTNNVNRATGIADQGFQAYTGNPYANTGTGGTPGSPGTEGYYTAESYDPYTGEMRPGEYVPGTPGTPATPGTGAAQFNPNNFVAPLTANQNMAVQGAHGLLGAGQDAVNLGVTGASNLLRYSPQSIMPAVANTNTAQATGATGVTYNPTGANAAGIDRSGVANLQQGSALDNISAYQNPYENAVVKSVLADMDTSRRQAIGSNQDAAIAARAFGGSRQGVADALTNEAYDRNTASTLANIRQSGYRDAVSQSQQDMSRNLQAQAANQGADLSVLGQNAGFQQQANLTNAGAANTAGQFNAGLLTGVNQGNAAAQNASSLANMGALNQGNQFNAGQINSAQAQNQQAGLQGASLNQSAAGLLGNLGQQQQNMYGTGLSALLQTGALGQQNQQAGLDAAYQEFLRQINQPYTGQSLINQSLGLLPQGGTTTQTGPKPDNTGGLLGGLGSIIGGAGLLFSDGRLKEDLTFDGYDNENRRWYTYRYIWDEHGMRRRGVIAQEVMQTDPEAVHLHESGYLMVDYDMLARKN